MELKELTEKTLELLQLKSTSEMSEALMSIVKSNDSDVYEEFKQLVNNDLTIDWLQKIFQYYQADRKEKMQDYTPKSLADFMGRLAGDSDTIIDMCAGSGALTIQKWNYNHDQKFILYEFDEKVIPFLAFNMAIRNIEARIYHADVLQNEIFHIYEIHRSKKYGEFKEIVNGNSVNI